MTGSFSYLGFTIGAALAILIGYLVVVQGKRINIKMSNMEMRIAINIKNNLPENSDGFFINVKDLSNWTLPSFTKKILNSIK